MYMYTYICLTHKHTHNIQRGRPVSPMSAYAYGCTRADTYVYTQKWYVYKHTHTHTHTHTRIPDIRSRSASISDVVGVASSILCHNLRMCVIYVWHAQRHMHALKTQKTRICVMLVLVGNGTLHMRTFKTCTDKLDVYVKDTQIRICRILAKVLSAGYTESCCAHARTHAHVTDIEAIIWSSPKSLKHISGTHTYRTYARAQTHKLTRAHTKKSTVTHCFSGS